MKHHFVVSPSHWLDRKLHLVNAKAFNAPLDQIIRLDTSFDRSPLTFNSGSYPLLAHSALANLRIPSSTSGCTSFFTSFCTIKHEVSKNALITFALQIIKQVRKWFLCTFAWKEEMGTINQPTCGLEPKLNIFLSELFHTTCKQKKGSPRSVFWWSC